MLRRSLRARLAVGLAATVALSVLLTSAVTVVSTTSLVNEDVDDYLRQQAEEIERGRAPEGRPGPDGLPVPPDTEELDLLAESALADDLQLQILDEDAEVALRRGVALPVEQPERDFVERDQPLLLRTVTVDGQRYRMLTDHIAGGGAVQLAVSLEATDDLLASIRPRAVAIGVALSLVAGAVGLVVARRTTRPLDELTTSVERITTTGELHEGSGIDREDEIGRLATAFDTMVAALAESRDQQRRLVQDAAHELRTPLTSVQANIDLLAHAPDLAAEEQAELIAAVQRELLELRALFSEIVELATERPADHEIGPVDLLEVARHSAEKARRRSETTIDVSGDRSVVEGDEEALERAVGNLLSNAVKFGPAGGVVAVTVGDGQVLVDDEGPGIPTGERDRVLDRFYRSDQARGLPGSGLGLAIVAQIVERHGGSIVVDDAPSGGARVGFRLPRSESDMPTPTPPASNTRS